MNEKYAKPKWGHLLNLMGPIFSFVLYSSSGSSCWFNFWTIGDFELSLFLSFYPPYRYFLMGGGAILSNFSPAKGLKLGWVGSVYLIRLLEEGVRVAEKSRLMLLPMGL